MSHQVFLSVDLGAGSGRVMAGIFDGSRLSLEEMNRFPNEPLRINSSWHWDFDKLLENITAGIAAALAKYGSSVRSLGVDTWGVDYGLLDAKGKLLRLPYQYRDSRTDGMMDAAYERMPKAEIYRRTGIQFMFFNTLFQLLAEGKAGGFYGAERLLFMPDLIHHALCGSTIVERTIASTSQLLNPVSGTWDTDLLHAMDLPAHLFGEIADAGTDAGALLPAILEKTGATDLRVILPGCHDTASAVAGVPSAGAVFLSSGTWSLFGRELQAPVISEAGFQAGFSNEGGVDGTIRYLKNISGMWLLQECKRHWDAAGSTATFADLVAEAESSPAFQAIIDPDDEAFQNPESMPDAIAQSLAAKGRKVPDTRGAVVRCILESLALKYSKVKNELEGITGEMVDTIHIVGGGSQNRLLNHFAAAATGCRVVAGPVEATSIGNILVQMRATGSIANHDEGRSLVRSSFPVEIFETENTARWDEVASAN